MTFFKGSVPVEILSGNLGIWIMLIGMMICGVCGGKIGKMLNRRLSSETVDKLFIILCLVIMLLCVWNIFTKSGI